MSRHSRSGDDRRAVGEHEIPRPMESVMVAHQERTNGTATTDRETIDQPTIDQAKVDAFLEKVIHEWGAVVSAPLVMIGERLGLYEAMSAAGPVTPAELAARTGTVERYVREWLLNQAAGGYLTYDPASGRYTLPAEHAAVLPSLFGGYQCYLGAVRAEDRIAEAFRTGGGMTWGEHHPGVHEGTERFFRVAYEALLVSTWIPALDGIEAKLEAGAVVADVGCGYGTSTIILAQAYPRSRFIGFDNHPASIEAARRAASEAGVADRVSFEIGTAESFPAPHGGYDLVAFFDCLHDMSDPVGAMRRAHAALAPGGSCMIVEPMAGERPEANMTPLGRALSAASTLLCVPHSLAGAGPALGTVASESEIQRVVLAGGFGQFRRAIETPFNRIFEARA
jgi:SAM-dependent methyltransferase